jgi:hypothetical protein
MDRQTVIFIRALCLRKFGKKNNRKVRGDYFKVRIDLKQIKSHLQYRLKKEAEK